MAGFLLANGALSDDGTELKIRKQLIKNHLVKAIIILPSELKELLIKEEKSKVDLLEVFKELGYEIEL